MFAILSCGASMLLAAMNAFLFPFAPACATPLNAPTITMFSPDITSAPLFTSPSITTLDSFSILCPDLSDVL